MDMPLAERAWPASMPHSVLWFVFPPTQGTRGQVRTRGQDGIVVSYGGRRREFHSCRYPVRLRERSTSRHCSKACSGSPRRCFSASRSCSASRRRRSCSVCFKCSAFLFLFLGLMLLLFMLPLLGF